ncbi:hypothetical protein GPECTOR_6g824 [Gonium pectorale]|uniref:Uncharacterized protein n=1 Tax=Gonium pectorale TaxID=33097 RepID=A0A150GVJ6_GONPE|nr:hypothetical protein GPECTOR_6g824 [Gonium pectorale]|eukprot:KXZ53906.1 hypothetical protein GPECTOR_6g824 [Gonium pectorale]
MMSEEAGGRLGRDRDEGAAQSSLATRAPAGRVVAAAGDGGSGSGSSEAEAAVGGMHGSGGEYEVVTATDAGAALGLPWRAACWVGSVGAGVVGAGMTAAAAAVAGAAGIGTALGAVLGRSLGGGSRGGSGPRREVDGGDVPLLGEEDVAIETAAQQQQQQQEEAERGAAAGEGAPMRAAALAAEEAEAQTTRGMGERGDASMAQQQQGSVGAKGQAAEKEAALELVGLQPLCEMGVNAGMYLGHGHTNIPGDSPRDEPTRRG